jgi:NADP-dependent aldehyde dehydrogenase
MTVIAGTDPRTATPLAGVAEASTADDVDAVARAAAAAGAALVALGRNGRADLLDAMADAVEGRRQELVEIASLETGFTETKLNGELTRAAYQLRFFGDVLREGGYLEAAIDPAGDTPMGPRPDLRRMLMPIGPVAVFGASNFPFAFSVLGGDTASALAAGCPVVLKAHDSHPATSKLSFEILADVAARYVPREVLGIVYGLTGGAELVAHSTIRAVAFTGSLTGGEALLDIIGSRPDPIPFYGELSSLNPIVVTPAAAAARGEQIGRDFVGSVTLGAGQLCTKPGLMLVPSGSDGDAVVHAAADALREVAPQLLLNARIHSSYVEGVTRLSGHRGLFAVGGPKAGTGNEGFHVDAAVFEVAWSDFDAAVVDEIFGPTTIVVRYDAHQVLAQVRAMAETLPKSLTATIHHDEDDADVVGELTAVLQEVAGRIVYNGYPTGVAVSWAQTHGGPWPSTNSLHTSVGATAIRRFLRPITFQNAPESVLPEELRDGFDGIPRRIDGVLVVPISRGRR